MTSEAPLDLRLLGAMEALVRGSAGDRRLGKGKPVALLAYLSLAPGRRASRERLATLLWSEGSSDAARQNLRQTLWYLKRRLGEVVQADDDSVALLPGATSDADRFAAAATAERYEEAVGTYLGDFVPEFAAPGAAGFEEWADLERRRLRATFVGCAEALARRQLAGGHATDAVRLAKRVRELAPDDPNAWRLLLEALVAARDALGAAAAVAQLEAELARDELEPDPAVRSLLRAARKLASGGDAEGGSADGAEASLVPDLIGREPEFRTLIDAWEGARRGRGRALLVSGAAGLGKTRLLAAHAARVISTRGRTVQVRAHPGNRTISGSLAAVIAEGLAALPGSAAISPGSASVLLALSPLLASSFRGAEPDRSTGDDATRRRGAALGELIGLLTETTPLALLVDDAHWADAESMRIVGALRGKVEESRAVLVTASRLPDDLRAQMGGVEEVALRPLDVAGVAEFVGRLAAVPTEPWSRHFVTRLHEVTHGIPLLLIETLQRLVEDGVLTRVEGQWHAASAEAVAQALPNESALIARLKSLSPPERTALVRLATIGRPVSPTTLPPAPEHGAWDGVLTELERRSFVARTERTVSVWHDEVARGVLELATPDERLAAHAWVSDALAERAATMAEHSLAALHASRAADESRMRQVWLAALRFAREQGDTRATEAVARDVFGEALGTDQVRRMVRQTPWSMRVGRRALGIGVAAALVIVAFAAGRWPRPDDAERLTVYIGVESDSSRVMRFEIARNDDWRTDDPIEGELLPAERSPVSFSYRTKDVSAIPGTRDWVASRTFPDSGGDEWVRVRADGTVDRLTTRRGDDWLIRPLADGSGFVANTRSLDLREHEAEIVRLDAEGRMIGRIASSAEDELDPHPSPDGTRIAFGRRMTTRSEPDELCVASLDGVDVRCAWNGLASEEVVVVGWSDARSILVQDPVTLALHGVDVVSGTATSLGVATCQLRRFPVRGFALANCADEQTREPYSGLAPLTAPRLVRPLLIAGGRTHSLFTMSVAVVGAPDGPHLDRVTLLVTDSSLSVGAAKAVRLSGVDQHGRPIEVHATRFSSSDPSVLSVMPDGTMRALAAGSVWIRGTAGGWRTDSALITVRPDRSASTLLLKEDWSRGIDAQWRAFGDPPPVRSSLAGSRVLLPSGDGVYESGVISRDGWNPEAGLAIDLDAWLPITRPRFQRLAIAFADGPSDSVVDDWINRSPAGHASFASLCAAGIPGGEGVRAVRRLHVVAQRDAPVAVPLADPVAFYGARWRRVRLQLFPDGRCGVAIDGEAVGRTGRPNPLPRRARVLVLGASVGTSIAVRGVEVWEGVRGDVVWR